MLHSLRYFYNLCTLLAAVTLNSTIVSSSQTTDPPQTFITFINDSLNTNVLPCDNFYDYVCSNHSPSGTQIVFDSFYNSVLPEIQKDKQYKDVSSALLERIDDCANMVDNKTFQRSIFIEYFRKFGALPLLNETVDSENNFFNAFLEMIFLSSNFRNDIGLFYEYNARKNAISFNRTKNIRQYFNNDSAYDEYFFKNWDKFLDIFGLPMAPDQMEKSNVSTFGFKFLSVIEKSLVTNNCSVSPQIKFSSLNNRKFKMALFNLLPFLLGESVNIANLYVIVDEKMIEELENLFANDLNTAQNFQLYLAMKAFPNFLDPAPETYELFGKIPKQYCFFRTINKYDIFGVYIANLLISKQFPMTTVSDQLLVRDLIENVRFVIREKLMSTFWLKNSSLILKNLDELTKITKTIGFSSMIENGQNYSSEINAFQSFYTSNNPIDKEIALQRAHRANAKNISEPDFDLNAYYSSGEQKIEFTHVLLQSPFFQANFPESYMLGLIGSIIGHEFFHGLSFPHAPANFNTSTEYQNVLNCYINFYDKQCFNLTLNESLTNVCSDGKDDLSENIPDVEGARVALQALKMKIGAEAMKVPATSALPFTNEQMFFIARAQFFCDKSQNDHSKFAKQLRDEDPHGADKVRVNAVSMQMTEFADAFNCKSSDAMVIDEKELCYLMSNKSST